MGYTKAQREAKKLADEASTNHLEADVADKLKENTKIIPKKVKKANIPLNTIVGCSNGTYGKLMYVSGKTNERHEWDAYGDVEYLELSELVSMKNSQKRFFTENWILIDDIDILKFLGVEKFYEKALNRDEIERLFSLQPEEVTKKIEGMTNGMKNTVAFYAAECIQNGSLDSRKMISALENSLNVELIEK